MGMDRVLFSRELPLDGSHLTASFEMYDNDVIGIHLMNCFDDGMLCDLALSIINRFKSRTVYDESYNGVYILLRGTIYIYEFFRGLPIRVDYMTNKTIVYSEIVEAQEALDWFLLEYSFFMPELPSGDGYCENYYKEVQIVDGKLKVGVPSFKEGSRHKSLLSYGGKLIAEGLDSDTITIKMHDANILYCAPPLPKEEVDAILKSVYKYYVREVSDYGK